MQIAYELRQTDVLALLQFRLRHARGIRKPILVRRLAYFAGFAFMALGSWFLLPNVVAAIAFLAFAIIVPLLYPLYFDWRIHKKVASAHRDPAAGLAFAPRTLSVTEYGLEEKSAMGETKVRWAVISDLTLTPTHAVISIQGTPSIIIPRDLVPPREFETFVAACQESMKQSRT